MSIGMRLACALSLSLWTVAGPALTVVEAAENWLHWRGPEQGGLYRGKRLFSDWSADGKNVLWKSPIGGRATPIILNGRVYLDCALDERTADSANAVGEQVICWDAKSGKVLWRDRFNVFQTDISVERVGWASMAGDAETGNVYLHSVSGLLRCYSGDGKVVWEHSLAERFGKISGYGGRTQPPIVDENCIIIGMLAQEPGVNAARPPRHYYMAFDKRNGNVVWSSAPGGKPLDTTYATPIVRVLGGVRTLIAGNADGACYGLEARTGKMLWRFRMSRRGLNSSPVCDGQYVYVCHGEDNIDNVSFGRVQCIDPSGRGDISETHSVWRMDGLAVGYASPVVHGNTLYVVSTTGVLHALDTATGKRLWKKSLGTTGRGGSPVWADDKLFVTEREGNVFILRPTRTGCDTLSHVHLKAADGRGDDAIHASFAFADGRGYLVSRDATHCIGTNAFEPARNVAVAEEPAAGAVTQLKLVPYQVDLRPGKKVKYHLLGYDKQGRMVGEVPARLETNTNFNSVSLSGMTATAAATKSASVGTVVAIPTGDIGKGLTAASHIRVFPKLDWSWDFEDLTGTQVPTTWVRAVKRLTPIRLDGNQVMRNSPGIGRPSTYVYLGPETMSGYTVQADVMVREQRRRMSNIGITGMRYNLILKGNAQQLEIQSWASVGRIAKQQPFEFQPDTWYRMKLHVALNGKRGIVRGKIWKRADSEPGDWTIEAEDPRPNRNGSPGLYTYSLSDAFFDNVSVIAKQ